MTKEQLKKYLNGVIDDIRTLYVKTQEQIQKVQETAKSGYSHFYNMPVRLTAEQAETQKQIARDVANKIMAEYKETLEKFIRDAEDTIASVKKAAIQDFVAAEPVPTELQLRMVDQIKKEYSADRGGLSLVQVKKFESALNYHTDNETIKAYPYYLAAKDLFPDDANNTEILAGIYMKQFPTLAEKKAVIDGIEECERFFKTAVICHKMDTIANATEVDQLEVIRMKQELAALGTIDQMNQRVITYVG